MHFLALVIGNDYEMILDKYSEYSEDYFTTEVIYTKPEIVGRRKGIVETLDKLAKYKIYLLDRNRLNQIHKHISGMSDQEFFLKVGEVEGDIDDKKENVITRYNPNAMFDWYGVGGRYSGFFAAKENLPSNAPVEYGPPVGEIKTLNVAQVKNIDWELSEKLWARRAEVWWNEKLETLIDHIVEGGINIMWQDYSTEMQVVELDRKKYIDLYSKPSPEAFVYEESLATDCDEVTFISDEWDPEYFNMFKKLMGDLNDDDYVTVIDMHN